MYMRYQTHNKIDFSFYLHLIGLKAISSRQELYFITSASASVLVPNTFSILVKMGQHEIPFYRIFATDRVSTDFSAYEPPKN